MKLSMIEIATSMIAFSTSIGLLFAGLYYLYQIQNLIFMQAILFTVIYININLLFLYVLKRWNE